MTRPGPPPPRGRHSAPDDDARPDEGVPVGRHAAADPPRRRHAAPERDGYSDPPPRRRHAAPDEPNGVPYHRPSIGSSIRYPDPNPGSNGHPGPRANGLTYGPDPSPDGYPATSSNGYASSGPGQHRHDPQQGFGPGPNGNGIGHRPEPSRNGSSAADGIAYRPDPAPNAPPAADRIGYRSEAGPRGYPSRNGAGPEPGPTGYAGENRSGPEPRPTGYAGQSRSGTRSNGAEPGAANGIGSGRERGSGGYAAPEVDPGRHRPAPGRNGLGPGQAEWSPAEPASGPIGYHLPNGGGHRRAEPDAGDQGPNGVAYHRPQPGAHRYGGVDAAPHLWPETNGYHLDSPAPPAVNGYRLDEPVVPVTGFPYAAPPPTPTAYPINGHGVDAAERDAASWPVNGFHPIELDRPPDPQIAVVPLYDEPTEVLDRPTPKPAATGQPVNQAKPAKPAHPPRAVVRRRRARRKALEWPFLIVFAVVSAFLIRQYVVQTFYIPSASMHETLIEGDRVLVNKVGYHLHDIHRGDVVVFRKPPNLNVSEDDLIKRVVALPGETVEGRGGKVYVNGAPLDEPYVEPLCHGTGEFPKVTVPAGTLWMMGDNRCNSSDSRVFGPIDEHLVVGRAFVIAWPFDRLSWL